MSLETHLSLASLNLSGYPFITSPYMQPKLRS